MLVYVSRVPFGCLRISTFCVSNTACHSLGEQHRPRNLSKRRRYDRLITVFGILLQATGPSQVHRIVQTETGRMNHVPTCVIGTDKVKAWISSPFLIGTVVAVGGVGWGVGETTGAPFRSAESNRQ
jgi:hypothetical protein